MIELGIGLKDFAVIIYLAFGLYLIKSNDDNLREKGLIKYLILWALTVFTWPLLIIIGVINHNYKKYVK